MIWTAFPGLAATYLTASGGSNDTIVDGTSVVGAGTCVETLQADGATALAATTTTEGNYGLCHFMFWTTKATVVSPTLYAASTGTYDWGQTNYLNETQWGTNGANVKGNGMRATNSGGTAITLTAQGHTLSPTKSSSSADLAIATYQLIWYQPVWANTYSASVLRRYNGGGTEAEKVKGYCVSKRLISNTSHAAGGFVAQTVATLTGATAIATGAIALGVAALAL